MVKLGIPVADERPSAKALADAAIAILNPNPTSCALLDEGDSALPGLALPGVFLSDVQYLTRCTELSKLL